MGKEMGAMASAAKKRTDITVVEPGDRDDNAVSPYVPRTPLGHELMAIRARIVASGQPLLDWDEIEREVAERRGGVPDES
jgi:hypothetical protein